MAAAVTPNQTTTFLCCEWILSDEERGEERVCGARFVAHALLVSHVQEHLSQVAATTFDSCPWNLCQFSTPDKSRYVPHVLFHAFHSLLKQRGAEFRSAKSLPECRTGSHLVNTVPPPEGPAARCSWECGGVRCQQTFLDPALFYSHVRSHVQNCTNSFNCGWSGCTFSASKQWNLQDHVRVHTQEKLTACPNCGLLFSNTTKLRDHLQRQATPADHTYFCSICKKCFVTERLLKEHFRKHVNTCKCPHCPMTCINHFALIQHITFRHSDSKPHECPLCHRKFKTSYSLSDHLSTHQEKSVHCSVAGCRYMGKSTKSLQAHMRREHGGSLGPQYCCHVCERKFERGIDLTGHLKSVHGFSLPPGHSRFRYITCDDGLKRLQTVRLDKDDIIAH